MQSKCPFQAVPYYLLISVASASACFRMVLMASVVRSCGHLTRNEGPWVCQFPVSDVAIVIWAVPSVRVGICVCGHGYCGGWDGAVPDSMKPSVKSAAHLRVEWLPTMPWNECPRSRGIGAQLPWNAHGSTGLFKILSIRPTKGVSHSSEPEIAHKSTARCSDIGSARPQFLTGAQNGVRRWK
jgi:hypothetical protein